MKDEERQNRSLVEDDPFLPRGETRLSKVSGSFPPIPALESQRRRPIATAETMSFMPGSSARRVLGSNVGSVLSA